MNNGSNEQWPSSKETVQWLVETFGEIELGPMEAMEWLGLNVGQTEGDDVWTPEALADLVGTAETLDPLAWLFEQQPAASNPVEGHGLAPGSPGEYLAETPVDDAIAETKTKLLTKKELDDLKKDYKPSAAQWRKVGDNQKALYRQRLLERAGHAPAGSIEPPFSFDNKDWQNIFQLEALVEFYVNFNDPWDFSRPYRLGENKPRLPLLPDGTKDPDYIEVNLLTGWHLVVVDSFGGRESLQGEAATAKDDEVILDGEPDLHTVNSNFDTIYLPNDTARPSRTYRIKEVKEKDHKVTLYGNPVLSGGSSKWHIPAGVSGELPDMDYNLGPGGPEGYDHLDGILFIVKNGEVHRNKYRWNSYTSRLLRPGDDPENLSSIRGNRRYLFCSYRSGGAFRNYSFKIVDHCACYDGVREARFFFATPVRSDVAPAGIEPGRNRGHPPGRFGKTLIRIHYTGIGSSKRRKMTVDSAGCLTSSDFYDFRSQMIQLYQDDYHRAYGLRDPDLERLRLHGTTHPDSKNLWHGRGVPTVTRDQWNNRLQGTVWLVRPDERPLGLPSSTRPLL